MQGLMSDAVWPDCIAATTKIAVMAVLTAACMSDNWHGRRVAFVNAVEFNKGRTNP